MFQNLRNALALLKAFIRLSAFCLHNTTPEPEARLALQKEKKSFEIFLKGAQRETTWHKFGTDLF